jgi:hypothetical protein
MKEFYYGSLTRIIFHGWKEEAINGRLEAGQPLATGELAQADWNEMTNSRRGMTLVQAYRTSQLVNDYNGDRPNQEHRTQTTLPLRGRYLPTCWALNGDQGYDAGSSKAAAKYQGLPTGRKWLRPANDRKLRRAVESICSMVSLRRLDTSDV